MTTPEPSLRQLRYFATLAEDLHFGKAAERLGISQPSLTRQIQALERSLGLGLLERTQRAVSLTAAGRAFAEKARVTLQHHERSIDAARNAASRAGESLAVGFECCAPYHLFPEIVRQFMTRFPRTQLSSLQMSSPAQAEALARNQIDLGFMHPPFPQADGLTFDRVSEDRFVLALPSSHRLAGKKRVACSALSGEAFALFPRNLAPGCFDAIQRICQAGGFQPNVVHECNEISLTLGLIPATGAVALFPECVAKRKAPGVVFRSLAGSSTTVTCGFLRRSGPPALAVRRFLELWKGYGGRVRQPA